MTPPPPIECEVPGCEFSTEEGIPSHELRIQRLKLHVQMAHTIPSQQAAPVASQKQRPAMIPRPELPEDATEQEWGHWKIKWERYKRSCLQGVDKTSIVDHLWACCTNELESAILKQAGKNPDTEDELLKLMEKLGVRKRNVLLNKVTFLDMRQENLEPVKLFAARLKGQAAVCDFKLPSGVTDYTDQMVQHQLIRGLNDQSIQEHILAYAATAEGAKMDLDSTVCMVEAKECGKKDSESLYRSSNVNKSSSLNKLSDYKKGVKEEGSPGSPGICKWCARTGHGYRANMEDRQKLCPAVDKLCNECGRKGHFAQVCKYKKNGEVKAFGNVGWPNGDDSTDEEVDQGEVLGSISGISGDGDVGGWLAL